MFPKDAETREKVAYPTMRHALGVSCALSSGSKRSSSNALNYGNFGDGSGETDGSYGAHSYHGHANSNRIATTSNTNSNSGRDGVSQIHTSKSNEINSKTDSNTSYNSADTINNPSSNSAYNSGNNSASAYTSGNNSSNTSRHNSIDNITFSQSQQLKYQTKYQEKYEAKIPTRHMNAILKDIFHNLLEEQPIVIIIEDSHDLDEASWKIIISLMRIQVKGFIVLTQEPIQYLMTLSTAAGSDSPIGELINPESSIYYDWIDAYINRLTNEKKMSYLLLPEFSFLEVRTCLRNILKLGVKELPAGLDQIVYNLSGGNPYW